MLDISFDFLISITDEAPDTGDDSDDDLITSYLGVEASSSTSAANAAVAAANAAPVVPTINVSKPSSNNNGNHILEENLLQLAEIHENIQRMRLENAAEAARNQQASFIAASGLSPANGRLSTSCPSLNETPDLMENGNNQEHFHNNNVVAAAAAVAAAANAAAASHSRGRSRAPLYHVPAGFENDNTPKSRQQAPQAQQRPKRGTGSGNRHRSVSVSSGDSEDDHHYQYHHQHHHYQRHSSASDAVDGCFKTSSSSRPRSSSSVDKDKGVFKTPPEVSKLMPRPPTSKKNPHLFAQFPALQKSISTPSIVVDHPHHKKHK